MARTLFKITWLGVGRLGALIMSSRSGSVVGAEDFEPRDDKTQQLL